MRRHTIMRILGVVRYVLVHLSVADDAYMEVRVRSQLFKVLGAYILHICVQICVHCFLQSFQWFIWVFTRL